MPSDNNNLNGISDVAGLFKDVRVIDNTSSSADAELAYLRSIDVTLKSILAKGGKMSQSSARESFNSREDFRNRERARRGDTYGRGSSSFESRSRNMDSFTDGFEKALVESFLGPNFKKNMGEAASSFAKEFGLNLETIRSDFGQELGKIASSKLKSNKFVQDITSAASGVKNRAVSQLKSSFRAGLEKYDAQNSTGGAFVRSFDNWTNRPRSASQTPSGTSQSAARSSVSSAFGANNAFTSSSFDSNLTSLSDNAGIAAEALLNLATYANVLYKQQSGDLESTVVDKFLESKRAQAEAKANESGGLPNSGDGLDSILSSDILSNAASEGLSQAMNSESIRAIFSGLGNIASDMGVHLAGVGANLVAFAPQILAVGAVFLILKSHLSTTIESIKELGKSFSNLMDAMSNAANRYAKSQEANLKESQDRIKDDLETYIKYPFTILEEAAQNLYDAWDKSIQKINGTQGYSKDDLQSLISDYASRLREEGLSSVVSSADITESLSKVLDSGLSGYAAEEFAYIATILNKAIPTQDFFNYADTYAELAGTALARGATEAQAVEYANAQLEEFASNVLYASRNLTGGFTTGLQDASGLLQDAIKIAQSAKSTNVSEISGVLTAVSAITGSIAPDLASSMTDAIVSAATGGNSSELVALRSLAGVNASNTEFLKQLADNPKRIFTDLFSNLANMQNMSNDAFMEVAEGLSSVFGISMEAFARIDFQYLANAINNMDTGNNTLADNMKLLAEGQTTTSTEMLRIQQINEYMIDEGLAYVMDNEAARQIQQHMWDEQMNRELMEATYAVELKGSALEFLQKLENTVNNILGFLNPVMWLNKGINLLTTALEGSAQRADIKTVLEAVKVGNGRAIDLYNLTTTNSDLHLTGNLAEVLTGMSAYGTISGIRSRFNSAARPLTSYLENTYNLSRYLDTVLSQSGSSGRRKSAYTWGSIGKSEAAALSGTRLSSDSSTYAAMASKQAASEAAEEAAKKVLASKLTQAANQMGAVDKNNDMIYKSYDDWKKASQRQIKDWDAALEASGLTESDLETRFQDYQTKAAAEIQQKRLDNEADFWQAGKDFWRADEFRVNEFQFWDTTMKWQVDQLQKTTDIFELLADTTNKILSGISKELQSIHQDWVDYYIRYTTYGTGEGELNAAGRRTYSYTDVAKIAAEEKNESYDAIHALAEALNKNIVDLHDPQVQTNALLGRILLVAEAILQQEQTGGSGTSTYDSLMSLATGNL